ncbi:MAG: gfo/Idh/MocA family oxidoreductase [Winogradskyella sp.]|uniref:Gfo/Idh/MocA family protein n=1 Tax=Winogradskyella sp. TaxID=1883156 RepID=UPI000F3EFF29|nr:Gfo/Idh/MocA family oxidoreductase [Winogradskyella sp.]RNC84232.1 MAG: gfo/Idh/MocA family oxidoreductase [Winogradskyella sp.]
MKTILLLFSLWITFNSTAQDQPLQVGVIGLTHTHVHWIFGSEPNGDIKIAGIVEPNKVLAQKYADQYKFSMDIVYDTMEELVSNTTIEAVTAFGTIYDHLEVVKFAAPKGIHVMVEKPLAVSLEHAKEMEALATQHNIHLLTNYETTWYPTTHKAYELTKEKDAIGEIRKIIVRDGHKGPKKIGVNSEFLEWLTDPKENGGGAITDFGCYGANILTWLMEGKRPNSVTAITQQLQPENNPKVDDESIILLQYDKTVAIIQGSWNWPIGRKDMEIYGLHGVIYADNRHDLRVRISEGYDGYDEQVLKLEERKTPFNDPFALLSAVVKNEVQLHKFDLNSLENNMIVVEILDAAKESARLNKTIYLKKE